MRDIRTYLSWQELAAKEFSEPPFLINPYIPAGGIVFLWGDTSVGKSPLGWEMARAVGSGTDFFGLPTELGKVLYIELDTPERLVAERLKKLPTLDPPEGGGVSFLFLPPLSVPMVAPADRQRLDEAASQSYALVIINTLRKCHSMNDKEAQTPKIVYEFFQRTFPGAALLFVHHSKKSQLNQATGTYEAGLDKESFSGAKNWINDAQVGLYLRKFKNPRTGTNLALNHEKTQVSDEYSPLLLRLEADGSTMTCPEAEQLAELRELVPRFREQGLGPSQIDERIAAACRISVRTARRRRNSLEGPVWLDRKRDVEDAEE